MSYSFKITDIPDDKSIHQFLLENTDLLQQGQRFEKAYPTCLRHLKKDLPLNFDDLKRDVLEVLCHKPPTPYSPLENLESDSYTSLFLTKNPYSKHPLINEAAAKENKTTELGYSKGKNSISDYIANNQKSEVAQYKSIATLFDKLKRQFIGSRIAILDGSNPQTLKLNFQWHTDAPIFLSTRINIPVVSDKNFGIQIMSVDKKKHANFELETGYVHLYNTGHYHRPTNKALNDTKRINLIVSVMPWFNIDHDDQVIYANEYYGKLHPFEMFEKELII